MQSEQNLSLPPELGCLSAFIDSNIECLTGSNSELRSLALRAAKHVFDWALETEESSKPHLKTLLATLTEAAPPQTRSRARNGAVATSHKRQTKINICGTPLPSLFIEGMNTDQIWEQLDLRGARVCENLQVLQGENEEDGNIEDSDNNGSQTEDEDEAAEMEVDDDDESAWEGLSGEEEDDGSSTSSTSTAEGVIDLQEESSEDDDEDMDGAPSTMDGVRGQQKPTPSRSHIQEYTGLDDGFFDLATFNAETDELERQEPPKRKLDRITDEDSAEESEVDLFGSVDDFETDGDGGGHAASSGLFYNDFFKPPTQTQNKNSGPSKVRFHERVSVKKIKAVGKGMPVSYMDDESDEEEDDANVT